MTLELRAMATAAAREEALRQAGERASAALSRLVRQVGFDFVIHCPARGTQGMLKASSATEAWQGTGLIEKRKL